MRGEADRSREAYQTNRVGWDDLTPTQRRTRAVLADEAKRRRLRTMFHLDQKNVDTTWMRWWKA